MVAFCKMRKQKRAFFHRKKKHRLDHQGQFSLFQSDGFHVRGMFVKKELSDLRKVFFTL